MGTRVSPDTNVLEQWRVEKLGRVGQAQEKGEMQT